RLGGELLMTVRSTPRGARMATPESALFNASQLVLATGAAGLVLRALDPGWTPSTTWGALAAVGIAAGSFYAVSELAVAAMVGIQTGRRPDVVLLSAVRLDALENATLLVAGFLVALAVQGRPWLALLLTLPAALAFVSLTKTTQLLEQTVDAVAALADVVDRRDPYTFEHSRRVAANAVRVAGRMRLSAREVDLVGMAARVHDLGKIGLPDAVLLKQGPLTDEEFALMKKHPEMGVEILTRFPRFRRGRDLVLHHHERPDGRGYPAGLRAGAIPRGAQIIAAADAFDAMTSARPYRSAMSCEAALAELRRGRGTQWSAAVVDVLVALVTEGEAEAERRPAASPAQVPRAAA
ncbi:MAG: HD-GYP domain-containing protein, partial [Candidatus Dormibacterales bacterium]